MPVSELEHFTIRCRSLEATRDFYRDFIGLTVGPRPNFDFKGYWLYLGGVPVVHLVEAPENQAVAQPGRGYHAKEAEHATGALDHVAFRGQDLQATITLLRRNNIKFRENAVPGGRIHQVFVHDPDGIMVELNFRDEAATQS